MQHDYLILVHGYLKKFGSYLRTILIGPHILYLNRAKFLFSNWNIHLYYSGMLPNQPPPGGAEGPLGAPAEIMSSMRNIKHAASVPEFTT